ncbi:MAG: hypothetical protein L0H94_03165, partial [Nitrospira sp.]|nr:hypothetical protein [Nitrospira sp.]
MPFTIRSNGRFPALYRLSRHVGLFFTVPQTYLLSFWLLLMFLILSSQSVYAEWVLVSGDDEAGLKV